MKEQLIDVLLNYWHEDYAEYCAKYVIEKHSVKELYSLAMANGIAKYPKTKCEQIVFRAAYVLESIYFIYREEFIPYEDIFLNDFAFIENSSAKRHFTKIMADILKYQCPSPTQCEQIAEACVKWLTEDKVKVAVQINAMEVLMMLLGKVLWLDEILPDIITLLERNPSSAMLVRLKRWKDKLRSGLNFIN